MQRRYWCRLAFKEIRAKIKTNIQRFRNKHNFLPEHIWDSAVKLKPKIKTNIPASEIPTRFSEANQAMSQVIEHPLLPSLRKSLIETEAISAKAINLFEKRMGIVNKRLNKSHNQLSRAVTAGFRVQARYIGLVPAIPIPSIHNLPRLAPLVEDTEDNNTNNTTTRQENGNELHRAA